MHRGDASTVSYTEVAVSAKRATMRYKPGPCCSSGAIVTQPARPLDLFSLDAFGLEIERRARFDARET